MIEFEAFPKIPRLKRDVVITEKIDGTNAAVIIDEDGAIGAQSRKRLVTPDDDNFGFARWVSENAGALVDTLGPGRHFGEWWGSGIQRGYGLTGGERRFSLFNVSRWNGVEGLAAVDGLGVVPELYRGAWDADAIDFQVDDLIFHGSVAAPGFMNPEGVVVYHAASRSLFKVMCVNDDTPKGAAA